MGGKQRLADDIIDAMNVPANTPRLVEPFCGALGFSTVFAKRFHRAELHVSDGEPRLISLWTACQTRAYDLQAACAKLLLGWECCETDDARKAWFYELRDAYNEGRTDDRDAAFLCLMKLGFNGLMRTNAKNELTTPMGFYVPGKMYKHGEVLRFGASLTKRWVFSCRSYEFSLDSIIPGSTVYLDPPYLEDPTLKSKSFQGYSATFFDEDWLPHYMRQAIRRGAARVAMSQTANAKHWRKVLPEAEQIPIYRRQGANSDRGTVGVPIVEEVLLLMRGPS